MHRTLLVNLDRCSGCDSCIVYCKYANGLQLGEYYNRVVAVGPYGDFPYVSMYWLPTCCQQCENPQCVRVCPTGASYRDPDTNVVLVNGDKCIGCEYCLYACPYGVRSMNKATGVAQKCNLCSQYTADGSDVPICVHNCPTGARLFGDIDDPESDINKEIAKYPAECVHHLSDPKNAKPTCTYILSPQYAEWKEIR